MTERWTLEKEFRFEASHQLTHHDGKCARLHGHSWVGRIAVSGNVLKASGPKRGMLWDYADLSAVMKPIVEQYLDHWHLNETLMHDSPTSEIIASWLWSRVTFDLLGLGMPPEMVKSLTVTIEETCTSRCTHSCS